MLQINFATLVFIIINLKAWYVNFTPLFAFFRLALFAVYFNINRFCCSYLKCVYKITHIDHFKNEMAVTVKRDKFKV